MGSFVLLRRYHEGVDDLEVVLDEGVVEIVAWHELAVVFVDERHSDISSPLSVCQIILFPLGAVIASCGATFAALCGCLDLHVLIFVVYFSE